MFWDLDCINLLLFVIMKLTVFIFFGHIVGLTHLLESMVEMCSWIVLGMPNPFCFEYLYVWLNVFLVAVKNINIFFYILISVSFSPFLSHSMKLMHTDCAPKKYCTLQEGNNLYVVVLKLVSHGGRGTLDDVVYHKTKHTLVSLKLILQLHILNRNFHGNFSDEFFVNPD